MIVINLHDLFFGIVVMLILLLIAISPAIFETVVEYGVRDSLKEVVLWIWRKVRNILMYALALLLLPFWDIGEGWIKYFKERKQRR